MNNPLKLVLVDDHPLILDGLRLALDQPGLRVVGTATSIAEARKCIDACCPDVVVLDLYLPDGSGMTLIPWIIEQDSHPAIVVLTLSTDPHLVDRALAAGARAYLAKGATREEIERAIRCAASGQLVIGASVSYKELGPRSSSPFADLSERERQVLHLVSKGRNNTQIGRQLGISAKTVANHLSAILIKLGVSDRTQAALLAARFEFDLGS